MGKCDQLQTTVDRVKSLHKRDECGLCAECSWEYPETSYDALSNDVEWPCRTIAAIEKGGNE